MELVLFLVQTADFAETLSYRVTPQPLGLIVDLICLEMLEFSQENWENCFGCNDIIELKFNLNEWIMT